MQDNANADLAVLIGRFQPFHLGHASLLAQALASAPQVVVVLGSSFQARNARNPFTWKERAAMMRATLSESERARVAFTAVRDYYDDSRWADAVCAAVAREAGANAQSARVVLVGHAKDASSYYLNHFPQWQSSVVDPAHQLDATSVRRVLFEAEDLAVSLSALEDTLALPVRQYLKAWALLPPFAGLVEEHRHVVAYKAAWKHAPYAPIFSTADALLVSAGHVLLVKRGGFPGKGLWALPGGFVEPRERLLQGAMRELIEETDRSQRGRTITHAHYFDLRSEALPTIQAADDAAAAAWIGLAELAVMEEQFFEDHFHILDHFLHLSA